MKKLTFTKFIQAPREKVWHSLFDKETYEQWTKPFNPTSRFEGSWDEGSKILFLGESENGTGTGGMVSRIAANRPHEFLSIEHLGIIENGVEILEGEKVKGWQGSHENYTLNEKDGGTELAVELDVDEENAEWMSGAWVTALDLLKGLAEK